MQQQNPMVLIAIVAGLAMTSLCCLGGAGAALYVGMARDEPAPSYPSYPPPSAAPSYPTPSYPTPSYPTPSAPSFPPGAPVTGMASPSISPDAPTRGPLDAPITIHVISDFQCPFCSRVEPTLARLDAAYPGRIRWIWHDYPLAFHTNAMPAAEAAREIRAQAGDAAFWQFHDQLFLTQSDLSRATYERLAAATPGVDLSRFRAALDSHVHQAAIQADMADVNATAPSSVGTPNFVINGRWMSGAQPYEAFQHRVDEALAGR